MENISLLHKKYKLKLPRILSNKVFTFHLHNNGCDLLSDSAEISPNRNFQVAKVAEAGAPGVFYDVVRRLDL
jgi:hypothetical protein